MSTSENLQDITVKGRVPKQAVAAQLRATTRGRGATLAPATLLRDARFACWQAKGVRRGDILPSDALGAIKHRMRLRNVNTKERIKVRSAGAQRSINVYKPGKPPKNGSGDALHADHPYRLTELELRAYKTLKTWERELPLLSVVVCVTATENYALEALEKKGLYGQAKYTAAHIVLRDITTKKVVHLP